MQTLWLSEAWILLELSLSWLHPPTSNNYWCTGSSDLSYTGINTPAYYVWRCSPWLHLTDHRSVDGSGPDSIVFEPLRPLIQVQYREGEGLRMHSVSHGQVGLERYGLLISQWSSLKAFANLSLFKHQGSHRLKGWQRWYKYHMNN